MKSYHARWKSSSLLFRILFTSAFFSSCEYYNFSAPQPVDKENIYEFPAEFQGKWLSDKESESINISEHYATISNSGNERIVKGIWPVLNDSGDYIFPPSFYKSFNTARFDSLKRPVDTIPNYLIHGNNIYAVNENGKLGKGYHFKTDKDTIIVLKNEVITIDLGRNAFLRKLTNDIYVMNIMNNILGEDNPWWQISILEKKGSEHLNILDCTGKLKKHPSMFYTEGSGNYYFDCKWTTGNMLRLMHDGNFEVSNKLRRNKRSTGVSIHQ